MATPPVYLLDTNILVHLIRGNATGAAILSNFGLLHGMNRCIVSVVTVGEMYALVRKWGWGSKKITDLEKLLGQVVWVLRQQSRRNERPAVLTLGVRALDGVADQQRSRPVGRDAKLEAAV